MGAIACRGCKSNKLPTKDFVCLTVEPGFGYEGVRFGESSSDDEKEKTRKILLLGRGARVDDIPLRKVQTSLSLFYSKLLFARGRCLF